MRIFVILKFILIISILKVRQLYIFLYDITKLLQIKININNIPKLNNRQMQITKQKLHQIQNSLIKQPISKPNFIYTIAKKQSESSFFSNDRLLFINLEQKTINYAHIPKYEPFVNNNMPQIKGSISIVNGNFKYMKVKQKQPTIKIWEQFGDKSMLENDKNKKGIDWKFQFFNADVLTQLIHIINFIYNNNVKSQISSKTIKPKPQNIQIAKNNNELDPKLINNKNLQIHTPSSYIINTEHQSPIHQLQELNNIEKKKLSAKDEKNNDQQIDQNSEESDEEDDKNKPPKNKQINYKKMLSGLETSKQKKKKVPKIKNFSRAYDKNQLQLQLSSIQNREDRTDREPIDPNFQNFNNNQDKDQDDYDFESGSGQNQQFQGQSPNYNKKKQSQSNTKNYDKQNDKQLLNNKNTNEKVEQKSRKSNINRSLNYNYRNNDNDLVQDKINKNTDKIIDNKNNQMDNLKNKEQEIHKMEQSNKQKQQQNQQKTKKFDLIPTILQNLLPNISTNLLPTLNINPINPQTTQQKTYTNPSHSYQSRRNCHINWNRIFYQSNHSIEIYQQFVNSCQTILKQKLFPYQFQDICNSNKSLITIHYDGILFNIYKYTSNAKLNDGYAEKKQPFPLYIDLKKPNLTQTQTKIQIQKLVQLYSQIHNQLQYQHYLWESNRYIMQKLLVNKRQKLYDSAHKQKVLINQIGINLACHLTYLGFDIYCQADLYEQYFVQCKNWKSEQKFKDMILSVERLIKIQLPRNCFKIYQSQNRDRDRDTEPNKNKSKSKNNSQVFYLLKITNPIFPIHQSNQSILTSYINRYTLKKYESMRNKYININKGEIPYLKLSASTSTKTLQSFIYQQIEQQLSLKLNSGKNNEISTKIYGICGSDQYMQICEYYNINKVNIKDMYILTTAEYYKQIIATQLCADIFCKLLIYTIHQQISSMYTRLKTSFIYELQTPKSQKVNFGGQQALLFLSDIQQLVRQTNYLWLNNLLSYNYPATMILWGYIKDIVFQVFGISIQQEGINKGNTNVDGSVEIISTLPGYLLDFVMKKLNIKIFYPNTIRNVINKKDSIKQNQKQKNLNRQSEANYPKIKLSGCEQSLYQFPVILNQAYSQQNILNFVKIDELLCHSTPKQIKSPKSKQFLNSFSKSQTPKSQKIQENQQANIQPLTYTIKTQQYRASKFNFIYQILETKILTHLISKKMIKIQTANIISGNLIQNNQIAGQVLEKFNVLSTIDQITSKNCLPSYFNYLDNFIKLYMAQYVAFSHRSKYSNVNIYDEKYLPMLISTDICELIPYFRAQLMIYIKIIKQLLYDKDQLLTCASKSKGGSYTKNNDINIDRALDLFNCVLEESIFWGGEFNPYQIQLYNIFSDFWVINQDIPQAIRYYKSAMAIIFKVYGHSIIVVDRHCYLAQLLCQIGKNTQAIQQYDRAIKMLQKQLRYRMYLYKYKQQNENINEHKYKQQDRLLILKYIKISIKRSKLELKINKNCQKDKLLEIIYPLLLILNEIKYNCGQKSQISDYNYKNQQIQCDCPQFMNGCLLDHEQLSPLLIQIIQFVYRIFAIYGINVHVPKILLKQNNKNLNLDTYMNAYVANPKIVEIIGTKLQNLKQLIKIIIYYQISNEVKSEKFFSIFKFIVDELISIGIDSNVKQTQAYEYLYHKYIKKVKKNGQPRYTTIRERDHQRSRSRSTGKKSQRPLINLLFKRLSDGIKNIQKIMSDINRKKLFNDHRSFNENTKSEAEQFLVLIEALGIFIGYQYILNVAAQKNVNSPSNFLGYYGHIVVDDDQDYKNRMVESQVRRLMEKQSEINSENQSKNYQI